MVAYLAFHYAGSAKSWSRRMDISQSRAVQLQRLSGVVLLGLVPAIVGWSVLGQPPWILGLGPPDLAVSAGFIALILAVVLPSVRWSAQQPSTWSAYPEIRARSWNNALWWSNVASWAAYLLAYEFFFRGFLLLPLVAWAGTWPAIAIVTSVYVAVHLTQPPGEAIGTLPMGFVFACVALASGGIWACWIGHVLIAAGNDYWVIEADPTVKRT
jgi:membrane protease YdiL (CAAX protease family)